MKRTRILNIAIGFLILVAADLSSISGSQRTNVDSLYLIKKIHIGEVQGLVNNDPLKSYLKQELKNNGFIVVDDLKDAEAELTGTIEMVLVADGDGTFIPDDTLRFQLISPGKEEIWKSKLKLSQRKTMDQNARYRAKEIVRKIVSDGRKSAKRAGVTP